MKKYFIPLFIVLSLIAIVVANIASGTALEDITKKLNSIEVKSDCKLKYARKDYHHWAKTPKANFDTRQAVLIRDSLLTPTFVNNRVKSGLWYDPYLDVDVEIAQDIDIDHVVALKEAHLSGACLWSENKKTRYANYLDSVDELKPVTRKINKKKGSKDPSKWIPPNKDYICEYLDSWVNIKYRWGLWVDKKEKKAIIGYSQRYCKD